MQNGSVSDFGYTNNAIGNRTAMSRAGTSVGANIHEAQYAHSKSDFIAKLQIALKETNETSYWLELLLKTNYIDEARYQEFH